MASTTADSNSTNTTDSTAAATGGRLRMLALTSE